MVNGTLIFGIVMVAVAVAGPELLPPDLQWHARIGGGVLALAAFANLLHGMSKARREKGQASPSHSDGQRRLEQKARGVGLSRGISDYYRRGAMRILVDEFGPTLETRFLADMAQDDNEDVVKHAIRGLADRRGPEVEAALQGVLARNGMDDARWEALLLLDATDRGVRKALVAMALKGGRRAGEAVKRLSDHLPATESELRALVGELTDESLAVTAAQALKDDQAIASVAIARAETGPALKELLNRLPATLAAVERVASEHKDLVVRLDAADGLRKAEGGGTPAATAYASVLHASDSAELVLRAVKGLDAGDGLTAEHLARLGNVAKAAVGAQALVLVRLEAKHNGRTEIAAVAKRAKMALRKADSAHDFDPTAILLTSLDEAPELSVAIGSALTSVSSSWTRKSLAEGLVAAGGPGRQAALAYLVSRAEEVGRGEVKRVPFPLLLEEGRQPDTAALLAELDVPSKARRKLATKILIGLSRSGDHETLRAELEDAQGSLGELGKARLAEVLRRWRDRAIPIRFAERDSRRSWRNWDW